MVKRCFLLLVFLQLATPLYADEIKIIPGKFGIPMGLNFVDSNGDVKKTIRKGLSRQANNVVDFTSAQMATTAELFPARTYILEAENHFLVNVHQERKVTKQEYDVTGIPFDIRNNITLYNKHTGKEESRLPNELCRPIALTRKADKFLCYYEPAYHPDYFEYGEQVDAELKQTNLYVYEKVGQEWEKAKIPGKGELNLSIISPNGQWLGMPDVSSTQENLYYIYSLQKPLSETPLKILKGPETKDVTRLSDKGAVLIDRYKVEFVDGKPVKNMLEPKILYQP